MTESTISALAALSDSLAAAVERGGASTVLVNGRRRFPASGVVWPGDGVVVTANHVVERDDNITVTLESGETVAATLAGRDAGSDIAVLRIPARPTPAGLAGPANVGQIVLALGRPEPQIMASFGIVSAVGGAWQTSSGTTVDGYLRTDTTFFPGFSGGPLVDVAGRVLGLNSSALGRGAGLTIPAAAVDGIVQSLLRQGRIKRGYLGVSTQPVRISEPLAAKLPKAQETGLLVVGTEPGSPVEAGGLLVGDILVRFAGTTLEDPHELRRLLGEDRVGQAIETLVLRGGEPLTLSITVGERAQ